VKRRTVTTEGLRWDDVEGMPSGLSDEFADDLYTREDLDDDEDQSGKAEYGEDNETP